MHLISSLTPSNSDRGTAEVGILSKQELEPNSRYIRSRSVKLERDDPDLPFPPNGQVNQCRSFTPKSTVSDESTQVPGFMLTLVAQPEAQVREQDAKDMGMPHTFTILDCDGELSIVAASDDQQCFESIVNRVVVSFRCPITAPSTPVDETFPHHVRYNPGDVATVLAIVGGFGLALSTLILRCERRPSICDILVDSLDRLCFHNRGRCGPGFRVGPLHTSHCSHLFLKVSPSPCFNIW
jgi:hypothetical protein